MSQIPLGNFFGFYQQKEVNNFSVEPNLFMSLR